MRRSLCVFLLSERFWRICTRELLLSFYNEHQDEKAVACRKHRSIDNHFVLTMSLLMNYLLQLHPNNLSGCCCQSSLQEILTMTDESCITSFDLLMIPSLSGIQSLQTLLDPDLVNTRPRS